MQTLLALANCSLEVSTYPALFIIFSTQRSGSTFYSQLLNQMPDVTCHSELFLGKQPKPSAINKSLWHQRHTKPFEFLREIQQLAKNQSHAVGFKLQPGQLKERFVNDIISSQSISKLVLIREKVFDIFMSEEKVVNYKAAGINQHATHFPQNFSESIKIDISAKAFAKTVERWSKWYRFILRALLKSQSNVLLVQYFDTLHDVDVLGGSWLEMQQFQFRRFLNLSGNGVLVNRSNLPGRRETSCSAKSALNLVSFVQNVTTDYGRNISAHLPHCVPCAQHTV